MEQINEWLKQFSAAILSAFPKRIRFIGIQGSYARGEASDTSDIDVVVIFDHLCGEDLRRYDEIIAPMEHRELICGFLSGEKELRHWERSELFQFVNDTKAIYGDLKDIITDYEKADIAAAVHAGGCAIYHACAHNLVHEKSLEMLQALYKQAVFALQAKHAYEKGSYIAKKADLKAELLPKDRMILEYGEVVKCTHTMDVSELQRYGDVLLGWAGDLIQAYDADEM